MACFSDNGVITDAILNFFAESDLTGLEEVDFSKFYWLENRLIMSDMLSFGLSELVGTSDMNLVENDSLMVRWSTLSFLRVDWLKDLSSCLGFFCADLE